MQSINISEAVKSVVRTGKGRQDVVGRTNWLRMVHASLCASIHAYRPASAGTFVEALALAAQRARRMFLAMCGAAAVPAYAGTDPAQGQRLARRVTAPDLG